MGEKGEIGKIVAHPIDSATNVTKILTGTFSDTAFLSPPAKLFIEVAASKAIKTGVPQDRIRETKKPITPDEFRRYWRRKRESTSSSPSNRHIGIYKSIAHHDELTDLRCSFQTICLTLAQPLDRHLIIYDTPFEKLDGNPRHDKLRIIQILEADLNQLLPVLWSSRLAKLIDEYDIRHPAQSAYGKGRDTIRIGLSKTIINDYTHLNFLTNVLVDLDASAACDRLTPHGQQLTTMRNGVAKEPVELLAKLIRTATHHIATAHGVSETSYTSTKEKPVV